MDTYKQTEAVLFFQVIHPSSSQQYMLLLHFVFLEKLGIQY